MLRENKKNHDVFIVVIDQLIEMTPSNICNKLLNTCDWFWFDFKILVFAVSFIPIGINHNFNIMNNWVRL